MSETEVALSNGHFRFSRTLAQRLSVLLVLLAVALLTTSCGLLTQPTNGNTLQLPASIPPGAVHQPYNTVIAVGGGTSPYQFSVTAGALPPGISLNPATGTLSGSPSTAGTFSFEVMVTDTPHPDQGDQTFSLLISGGTITVNVSPASVTLLSSQTQQFTATVSGTSNTAVTWSAGKGSVNANGLYTAPVVSATTNVVVTATSTADSSKSATAAVTVNPAGTQSLTITTKNLPQGQQGEAYSEVFAATGGTTPYSWKISAGTPPTGIAMHTNGDLAGTPTATGVFNFTVTVTDATNKTAIGNFSVTVNGSSGSGGPPLTYSARTDNCVTGSESNCTGASTGKAGSALSFRLRTTDAVPFSERAAMNSTATDPDFGAYLVMATDESTANAVGSSTPWAASWFMGSAGEWDAFSADSKMLLVHNQNGNVTVLYLNPSSIHAKTCATIPCVTSSGIGSQSPTNTYHLAQNGDWDFSRLSSETNVLYERGNPPTQVSKLRICKSTQDPGCSAWTGPGPLLRTPYVDFTSDTPVGCSVLPASYAASWTSTFAVADDGSVAYGMAGGQDWLASWTPTVNESFILPQSNNAGRYGFQATAVTGPTSSGPVAWCQAKGCKQIDGGVTWTNIDAVGAQETGFDIVIYRPSQGCSRINTRIGKIYQGTGNSAPAGLTTTNDNIACTRAANGGSITYPCTLPDKYTLHDFSQTQNGQYVVIAPHGSEGANPAGNYNSGTLSGQISNATWSYGIGGGNGVWNAAFTYSINDVVVYGNPAFYYTSLVNGNTGKIPTSTLGTAWNRTEAYPAAYIFDTTGTLVAPCTAYLSCNGHSAQGYLSKYWGGTWRASAYSSPAINGAMNSGVKMLDVGLIDDSHGTYRNSGTDDLTPIFMSTTNVPDWYTRYTAPCYAEICAVSSDGQNTLYRFGHSFNTSSSPYFSAQNAIGVVSPLGDLMAFGTDMMGTRGDKSAANTVCSNKLRGMYQPAPGMTLNHGDTVLPVTGNLGGFIYQTTTGGTSGVTVTWNQTVGSRVTYGTAVLQNMGANSCRSDVVILDTLSAHAVP